MIGYKLNRREEAVSESEFSRSRQVMRAAAVVWISLLVAGIMTVGLEQWYYLGGMLVVFLVLMPAPVEIIQSYDHYKKKWLRDGGATRGEKVARLHG